MLAGASTSDNTSYYLYNSDIETDYYTMSSARYVNNVYYPFIVTTNGAIDYNTSGELLRGIRHSNNILKLRELLVMEPKIILIKYLKTRANSSFSLLKEY